MIVDDSVAVIVCAGPSIERLSATAWRELERAGAVVGVNGAPASRACREHGVRFTCLAAMDIAHGLAPLVPGLADLWATTAAWRVTSVEARGTVAETYLVEVDEEHGIDGWSDVHDQGYKGGSSAMVIGNWLGNRWPGQVDLARLAVEHGKRPPARGFRTLAYVGLDMHFRDGRHAAGAGCHLSGFSDNVERHRRVCDSWGKLCEKAAGRGVRVVNLSPGSALAEMPRCSIPERWLVTNESLVLQEAP